MTANRIKTSPKSVLDAKGLRPNKSLGQNFLVDQGIISKLICAISPSPEDFIIEIGPGLGALALPLARKAGKLVGLELDKNLADILEEAFNDEGLTNASVIHGDFMRMDLTGVIPKDRPYKIAGNLPYYITTPAIRRIFSWDIKPAIVTLLLQKEAAAKLTALPGSEDYGILTLETAYHAKVTTICDVPPACFYPQPKVQSRALRLDILETPPAASDKAALFKVINAAFSMRRKTLLNCLVSGLNMSRNEAAAAVSACGFPADIRGERLGLMEFDRLTAKLKLAPLNPINTNKRSGL